MAPEIRPATAADLDAVLEITRRAYAPYLPVLGHPPVPVTEDYAPRIAAGEVQLLCGPEGPVGLIVVERKAGHDMIFSVAVDPAHAGHGLGPKMIAHVEAQAREAGKAEVRLYTNALMERNIALYQRLGYRETGRRRNPKRPEFTIVDMVKAL